MIIHSYFPEIYGSAGVSENGGLHTHVYLSIVCICFHEHFMDLQMPNFLDKVVCYMVLVIYLHGWAMFGVNGGKYMRNFHMEHLGTNCGGAQQT